MKKFFALLMCALMAAVVMVPAMAADDYILNVDFEAEMEGPWIAVDKTLIPVKKSGTIEVAKIGDTMAMKVHHPDGVGKAFDPYIDLLQSEPRNGDVSDFGCGQQVVVEYDLYFESSCDKMNWQCCLSREYPVPEDTNVSVQWAHAAHIKGTDLGVYIPGMADAVAHLELKKWHSMAFAIDTKNDVFSVYLDGTALVKDYDYTVSNTAADYSNLYRIAFSSWDEGEACAYVDNIKIYNAEQPRGLESAVPVVTTAPETTAAPATEAATQATVVPSAPAAPTADVAVILAAVSAIAASGAVVFKKKR